MLKVPCPLCEAGAGLLCRRMLPRYKRENAKERAIAQHAGAPINQPHRERVAAAAAAAAAEIPDGRAGDDTDVPSDPRAVAVALISEIRNALIPARHELGRVTTHPIKGMIAADRLERARRAVQRVLNYATQCEVRLLSAAPAP